jgi:DNA-directed RNA polymerase specialized sigma24 family protein
VTGRDGSVQTSTVLAAQACDTHKRGETNTQFRALYQSEFGYVWNSLRRLGVPERDLEDLSHNLFLAVYRTFEDYDPASPIRPWALRFRFSDRERL